MSAGQVPETSRMLVTRTHHVYAEAWPTAGLPAPPWSLGLRGTIPKCFGCLAEDPQTGGFCGNGSFLAPCQVWQWQVVQRGLGKALLALSA